MCSLLSEAKMIPEHHNTRNSATRIPFKNMCLTVIYLSLYYYDRIQLIYLPFKVKHRWIGYIIANFSL